MNGKQIFNKLERITWHSSCYDNVRARNVDGSQQAKDAYWENRRRKI